MLSPQDVLQKVFGYSQFRGDQLSIINDVLSGRDVLVLMPTGAGKSLCYQIPALLRPGVAVVISPLIALMQDQVRGLQALGVRAAYLNSTLSFEEVKEVERKLRRTELDLLYVAPERLLTQRCLDLLKSVNIALIAIDEAHCVSQWGHDFRPEYLQLGVLKTEFPSVPRIGVTATADDLTRKDIIQRLELNSAKVYVSSFDRPNIFYEVVPRKQANEQLLNFINRKHPKEAGIVYCPTRNKVESTAEWLCEKGIRALPYHAGLPQEERAQNQTIFLNEEACVMVATVAFGMGINKSNVRFVAHLGLPKSTEAYYQETGRAGRDGLAANAWMTYSLADVISVRELLARSELSAERQQIENARLNSLLAYAEAASCRRQIILNYFGETSSEPCQNCDNCLRPPQTFNATIPAQKALSAVYRSGERFGVVYLIDILHGRENEKILKFGHQRLSTYGIGKDLSREEWHTIFRQLLARAYLSIDLEHYGVLKLTAQAKTLLQGQEEIFLRRDIISSKTESGKKTKKRNFADKNSTEDSERSDSGLFEQLRSHRMRLSKALNVPPYIIFTDATLHEMASLRPQTLDDLRSVSGIGEHKLSRWGQSFLEIILKEPAQAG